MPKKIINKNVIKFSSEVEKLLNKELEFKKNAFPEEEIHLRIYWQSEIYFSNGSSISGGLHVQALPGKIQKGEILIQEAELCFVVDKYDLEDVEGKEVKVVDNTLMLK